MKWVGDADNAIEKWGVGYLLENLFSIFSTIFLSFPLHFIDMIYRLFCGYFDAKYLYFALCLLFCDKIGVNSLFFEANRGKIAIFEMEMRPTR
jgi:hypothetical protein